MSQLLAKIKAAQLTVRKARDAASTAALTTLIGETEMIAKNEGRELTDIDVIRKVKKFIDGAEETAKLLAGKAESAARHAAVVAEKALYESFLPEQYTGTRLQSLVATAIDLVGATTLRDMGKVNKHLADNYPGMYNGGEASSLVKAILQ